VVRLRDTKGLRHRARLLAQPAGEVLAVDLEAAECRPAGTAVAGPRGRAGAGELEVRPDLGDAGTLLDAPAKAAYRVRLGELRVELEEARSGNDPVRASQAQAELDFLAEHLSSTIRTGRYCSHTPDPRAPIRWEC
jgi:hypothetical protein